MENISKCFNRRKNAFSIIEVLLVLGIFFLIVFLSLPLVRGVFYQNDLEDASLLIVSTIRQAENNSRNGLEDSVWGVRLTYPNVVLFKGATYGSRDTAFDVGVTLSSGITMSGLSEVTFSKMLGLPSVTGDIIITNLNNKTVNININAKGTLSY